MPAVSLEAVSKRYHIFENRRDQLKRVLSFGKSKAGSEFWALKNVNLEVEPGTALGLLGRNGAGKTTLLQIVSGVLQPTSGTARVNGRLVALFQLGAGFNDDFTGRENVMMNGLILGIEREEMLERFDEIEAFADIGEFMYQPVRTYSSGMRARLGFAVPETRFSRPRGYRRCVSSGIPGSPSCSSLTARHRCRTSAMRLSYSTRASSCPAATPAR
jgi:ABC-type polysaccharide/polyol phosphate transport system ATPase subunit